MNLHLAEIAAEVAPDKHAVLVVDQAGWHLSAGLVLPDNITLVVLPPKCPELNPAENVWQFMRDNWLSNRVFASYTDLSLRYPSTKHLPAKRSRLRRRGLHCRANACATAVRHLLPLNRSPPTSGAFHVRRRNRCHDPAHFRPNTKPQKRPS